MRRLSPKKNRRDIGLKSLSRKAIEKRFRSKRFKSNEKKCNQNIAKNNGLKEDINAIHKKENLFQCILKIVTKISH